MQSVFSAAARRDLWSREQIYCVPSEENKFNRRFVIPPAENRRFTREA